MTRQWMQKLLLKCKLCAKPIRTWSKNLSWNVSGVTFKRTLLAQSRTRDLTQPPIGSNSTICQRRASTKSLMTESLIRTVKVVTTSSKDCMKTNALPNKKSTRNNSRGRNSDCSFITVTNRLSSLRNNRESDWAPWATDTKTISRCSRTASTVIRVRSRHSLAIRWS